LRCVRKLKIMNVDSPLKGFRGIVFCGRVQSS